MYQVRIRFSRLATLLVLISFFLVNLSYADVCKDRNSDRNEQKQSCCQNISAEDSNESEDSDSNPLANHCFDCCSINVDMVRNSAKVDKALVLLGSVSLPQNFLFPSFVTSIERPPQAI